MISLSVKLNLQTTVLRCEIRQHRRLKNALQPSTFTVTAMASALSPLYWAFTVFITTNSIRSGRHSFATCLSLYGLLVLKYIVMDTWFVTHAQLAYMLHIFWRRGRCKYWLRLIVKRQSHLVFFMIHHDYAELESNGLRGRHVREYVHTPPVRCCSAAARCYRIGA